MTAFNQSFVFFVLFFLTIAILHIGEMFPLISI